MRWRTRDRGREVRDGEQKWRWVQLVALSIPRLRTETPPPDR